MSTFLREKKLGRKDIPLESVDPSSDSGVMGDGLRSYFSDRGGETDPGDEVGEWPEAAISRYHRRHEMFSSRRPSLRDSLHFVKTNQMEHGQ